MTRIVAAVMPLWLVRMCFADEALVAIALRDNITVAATHRSALSLLSANVHLQPLAHVTSACGLFLHAFVFEPPIDRSSYLLALYHSVSVLNGFQSRRLFIVDIEGVFFLRHTYVFV